MGVKAHFSSDLTCSEHSYVLPAWVSPRSPSILHLNIPDSPEASPGIQGNPEGQWNRRFTEACTCLHPETSGLPPKTSSRGGQSQALAEVESKEDSLLYRFRSARLITGTMLHANEGVRRLKSPVEEGSSEQEDPKVLPRDCPRSVGAAAGSADTLGLHSQVPETE